MEFQPEGTVKVSLNLGPNQPKETYEWNKITTCIHNLFGGSDRWVDLYGQCVIKSKSLTCKIDFVKASYWSNKRHEIYGTITDKNGNQEKEREIRLKDTLRCMIFYFFQAKSYNIFSGNGVKPFIAGKRLLPSAFGVQQCCLPTPVSIMDSPDSLLSSTKFFRMRKRSCPSRILDLDLIRGCLRWVGKIPKVAELSCELLKSTTFFVNRRVKLMKLKTWSLSLSNSSASDVVPWKSAVRFTAPDGSRGSAWQRGPQQTARKTGNLPGSTGKSEKTPKDSKCWTSIGCGNARGREDLWVVYSLQLNYGY